MVASGEFQVHDGRMTETPSAPQGRQPDPTGRFGEGAGDKQGYDSAPGYKGDSVQHVSRASGQPRSGGDEDTADRPPVIDRSQDSY